MSCNDPHHLSKTDVAVVFVIFTVLVSAVWVMASNTDEQARLDAIDAMCRTYAKMDGGARQVFGDEQHGFFVECQNATKFDLNGDVMRNFLVNITVVQ